MCGGGGGGRRGVGGGGVGWDMVACWCQLGTDV